MVSKILEVLNGVSITQEEGQLFADKSYKYDTVFFLSKFILNNLNAENCFEANTYENNALSYIKDIFNLKADEEKQKIKNYLAETITILLFSKVIKKQERNIFKIIHKDVLEFISLCPENAYIFLYLTAYKTLLNDNKLDLYKKYAMASLEEKQKLIIDIENYVKLTPGLEKWSPFKTKFLLMVLGYANNDFQVARTLNVKNKKIDIQSISINIEGTRTPKHLPKKNDYIDAFNREYVVKMLESYIFTEEKVEDFEYPKSHLANELADLKIAILKSAETTRQKSNIDQDQYIETTIKTRNNNVQRTFRDGLFKNNIHKCPVCGYEFKEFLIASHIVPYSSCEDTYDAINYYNGFLMCPNHDKIFEKAKHMTIDANTGEILLSKKALDSKDYQDLKGKFVDKSLIECERRHYLKWHNKYFREINN